MMLYVARDDDVYAETCIYLGMPLLNEEGRWYADNRPREVLVQAADSPMSPVLAELVKPLRIRPGECIQVVLTGICLEKGKGKKDAD